MWSDRNPEFFLTLAAERNFSKAAERLYISQPYLSQYIIHLEENLGCKLFERKKTPLELTEAGQLYALYLKSSVQLQQKLMSDIAALKNDDTKTLRIGLSSWRAGVLLPDILSAFSREHANTHLELIEQSTNNLYRMAAEGKLDIAILNAPLNPSDEIVMETIAYERILLVGNRDNPVVEQLLAQQEQGLEPNLRLLEQERVILLRPEIFLGARVQNYLDKNQITFKNITYTTNAATALNFVAGNLGFCFLNETGADYAPRRDKLAFFQFASSDMVHPLCAIYQKNSYLLPAARDFIDLAEQFYRQGIFN